MDVIVDLSLGKFPRVKCYRMELLVILSLRQYCRQCKITCIRFYYRLFFRMEMSQYRCRCESVFKGCEGFFTCFGPLELPQILLCQVCQRFRYCRIVMYESPVEVCKSHEFLHFFYGLWGFPVSNRLYLLRRH